MSSAENLNFNLISYSYNKLFYIFEVKANFKFTSVLELSLTSGISKYLHSLFYKKITINIHDFVASLESLAVQF